MGTQYYMTKGNEKIYVGRNLSMGIEEDIKQKLDEVCDKYLYMEIPMEFLNKKIGDLDMSDYGKIDTYLNAFYDMVFLLEHIRLVNFYTEHYNDYKEWELKTDYELSEEEQTMKTEKEIRREIKKMKDNFIKTTMFGKEAYYFSGYTDALEWVLGEKKEDK